MAVLSLGEFEQRERALRDAALLTVIRPADDPNTGLSMRQDTPQAARYRTVLDKTLDKYGSKAAFEQAFTTPDDLELGEFRSAGILTLEEFESR